MTQPPLASQAPLFSPQQSSEPETIELPDGELSFWPRFDLGIDHETLMRELINSCNLRQQTITLFGKSHRQPRLTDWYGDAGYRYSGLQLKASAWPDRLLAIRARIEAASGHAFNSVLLNYYRDQHDRMGMHSDDEPELGRNPVIASLSLGETREFRLRHRSRRDLATVKLPLAGGSLLLMRGSTQHHWKHGINAQTRDCGERLNLTFRLIKSGDRDD